MFKLVGGVGNPVPVGSGLVDPVDVFVTASGDVYICDLQNNNRKIKKFVNGAGTPTVIGSTIGSALARNYYSPNGVWVNDSNGDVYVADEGNDMVWKVPGGTGTPVAIATGQDSPLSVWVTTSGEVFWANYDWPYTVKKVVEGSGASPVSIGAANTFQYPDDVFVTPAGDVYITDQGFGGIGKVRKYVGGTGTPIEIGTGWQFPNGIYVTPAGDVYVSDINIGIRKYTGGTGSPVVIGQGNFTFPSRLFLKC